MSLKRRARNKPEFMPVCLRMRGQKCLVIGGGTVALRKINTLRKFGADITCISPMLIGQLQHLRTAKKIKYRKAPYSDQLSFKKYKLIIAATDNARLNQKIAVRSRKERVLLNAVTGKKTGDVLMPAIFKRDGTLVAVSTDGQDPRMAKKVRDQLRHAL